MAKHFKHTYGNDSELSAYKYFFLFITGFNFVMDRKEQIDHSEVPADTISKNIPKFMNSENNEYTNKGNTIPNETPLVETHEDSSDLDSGVDFTLAKKKKKKKVTFLSDTVTSVGKEAVTNKCALDLSTAEKCMANDTADYSYDFLLSRIYNLMREKNPNFGEDLKKKIVMKPPQVLRVGTKKTSFANFLEICKLLHRSPQHIQSFLLVELGTSGSIDGNNHLLIKGKFQQKQIEHVLRRYIKEYVTCHTCHSPETILQKDARLCFLQCESCGSRCSVASIKSGFQAVIGKRAAIRAKIT